MKKLTTKIPGVYIIENNLFQDNRGDFLKVFNKDIFEELNLESDFQEQFYSTSKKNVIRGMHFQKPPFDHAKLVYVTSGKILDVILDIRKGSPTFGKHIKIILSAENNRSVYIPKGCAHGFLSKIDNSIVTYNQTSGYHSNSDGGVNYNSFGFEWNINEPIVSEKDQNLSPFQKFDSPFIYKAIK